MQEEFTENGPVADRESEQIKSENHLKEAVGEQIVEPENALPEVTLDKLPELSRAACARA